MDSPLPTPVPTVVTFGDSLTALRMGLVVYTDQLRAAFEREKRAARFINSGTGGNTTAHALERLQRDVLDHNPTAVVMMFGINDSAIDVHLGKTEPRVALEDYRANLHQMLDAMQAQNIRVLLMAPPPINLMAYPHIRDLYAKPPYTERGSNFLLHDYRATLKEIAQVRGVPLVDLWPLFASPDDETALDLNLTLDGLHPNQAGQDRVAAAILPLIRALLPA